MIDRLNIAVLGAGYWGPNLIRNVAQNASARLHTLCDIDEKRLQSAVQQYAPLNHTTDFATVFGSDDIDGIIIATPAHTHYDLAKQALLADKHIMVEKPLALHAEEASELIDLAKQRERILMVGHVFLYNTAVQKLHDLIRADELGKLYYIYSIRVNLGRIRDDLNAFWNLAPHDISIINKLLGQVPGRVTAHGYSYLQSATGLEDVTFAILEYPNGVAAHVHVSWLDPNKVRRMTVVGEKKMVVYDDISENRITVYDKGAAWVEDTDSYGVHRLQTFTGDIHIPKIKPVEPLRAEIDHFLDCIRTGQKPISDGDEGLGVIRVLEAVSESLLRGGQPVDL